MDRVYQANVSTIPTPLPVPGSYGFVQSSFPHPLVGVDLPTEPGAQWYFWHTESIRNVILAANMIPDPLNLHQLRDAIEYLKTNLPFDLYWADVVLSLHGNNGSGSEVFTDSSTRAQTVTGTGGIQQVTDEVKFGPSSIGFNGTNQYLQSTSSDYILGPLVDFTIEQWIWWGGANSSPHIWQLDAGSEGDRINLFLEGGLMFFHIEDGTGDNAISAAFNIVESWVHVRVTGESGLTTLWINGNPAGSTTQSIPVGLDTLTIGYQPRPADFNSDFFDGRMDDFRFTVPIARNSGPFAVPTTQFPDRGPT